MTQVHKNILRGLLVALGITAGAGVLSVLMQDSMMGRVTGTSFVIVLAALIMLKIAAALEHEKKRPAAIFGLGVTAVETVLVLVLIWSDVLAFVDSQKLLSSVFALPIWSLPTTFAVRAVSVRLSRNAGWVGIGFAVLTLVTGAAAIWGPIETEEEWYLSTGLSVAMGLAVSASCVGLGAPPEAKLPPRYWRWIGILAGAGAVTLGMYAIWAAKGANEEAYMRTASLPALAAAYVGFANIALFTPLNPNQRWLLIATLASGLATCVLIALAVFEVTDDRDSVRYISAMAIPTVCGVIALAAVARFNKRPESELTAPDYLSIYLACPRCRSEQEIKPGKSRCRYCDLMFDIKFEEPKCPHCDYLLHMIEGKTCPECGAPIVKQVLRTDTSS